MSATLSEKLKLLLLAVFFGALTTTGVALVIGINSPGVMTLWSVLIPSGVCGITAFGYVLWRYHIGESLRELWRLLCDLWNAIGKMP